MERKADIKLQNNLKRLKDGDIGVWDEYEAEIEFSDKNETRDALLKEIGHLGKEILQKRPLGIHSIKYTNAEPGLIVAMKILYQNGGNETRWLFEPDSSEKFEGRLQGGLLMSRLSVEHLM